MRLKLNGREEEFPDIRTAMDLLTKLGIERERVAVMINDDVIRRAALGETEIHEGDCVEVITMVGGG